MCVNDQDECEILFEIPTYLLLTYLQLTNIKYFSLFIKQIKNNKEVDIVKYFGYHNILLLNLP